MSEKIYIGSYSNNIKVCKFDNGELEITNVSKNIVNPAYLHINKDRLYAVSETETGGLAEFEILDDELELKNFKVINEDSPCHIATDVRRETMVVSNYGSGTLVMYEIDEEGSIERENWKGTYTSNSRMHFAEFIGEDETFLKDKFLYVVDLGDDKIHLYGKNMTDWENIKLPKGSGPRHLLVTNNGKTIYVVTELSNQIFVYRYEEDKFNFIQEISTLPDTNIESYAGAIKVSKDNKYIYVTNRGHNSISVFSIKDEKLELIQNIEAHGDFPRDITLNETEEYALVANQKSNSINVFRRDKGTGMLEAEEMKLEVESPTCIERRNV